MHYNSIITITNVFNFIVFRAQLGLLNVYYIEGFMAALLCVENVKQLYCTNVCSLLFSHVGAGVFQYYCDFNKIECINWFQF